MKANAVSRRDFVKRAALVPFCAATVMGGLAAEAHGPVKRAGGSALKVSLNAYSFNKLLNDYNQNHDRGISLMALLEFCAKNDFDAIDITGYYFSGYPQVPSDDTLYAFKRTAFEYGIGISGTGVKNRFTTSDKAERAASLQLIKDWVIVAAKLGAPVIRVFCDTPQAPGLKTWQDAAKGFAREQVQAWMVDALGECAEHGKKHGVIIGVQNHGDFLKTADQLLSLIHAVNSDWCGAIVDTGLFQSDDPYADIAKAAPYAVNWQIKQRQVNGKSDRLTDLTKLIGIVRASGYRGYLPIETFAAPNEVYDPFVDVPSFLKQVRAAIAQTA